MKSTNSTQQALPSIDITEPEPLSLTEAVRQVRSQLVWDYNPPAEERRLGADEAQHLIRHQLDDRIALLRILAGLARGPVGFLAALQDAEPFASEPAGVVPIELFSDYIFGALSGGPEGCYAQAFIGEFAAAAPYVASVH